MGRRVFIVPGFAEKSYEDLFLEMGFLIVKKLEDADLVCFGGGTDIGTHLYNQVKHPNTQTHNDARDAREVETYKRAVELDKKIVGICRGAQLINVLNGGDMYQHVTGHTSGMHSVIDLVEDQLYHMNSIHHQMMRPPKEAEVVAIATQMGRKEYMQDNAITTVHDELEDPEVVWFPLTSSLAFQGHPEFDHGNTKKYFEVLLKRYFDL